MTVAPWSASIIVAKGPASIIVRSSTTTPDNAPGKEAGPVPTAQPRRFSATRRSAITQSLSSWFSP